MYQHTRRSKGGKKDDQKVSRPQKCANTPIFLGTVKRSLRTLMLTMTRYSICMAAFEQKVIRVRNCTGHKTASGTFTGSSC